MKEALLILAGLFVGVVGSLFMVNNTQPEVGAANRAFEYVYDFANGFYVGGSQVADSSGNITVNGTLSSLSEINTFGNAVTSTIQVGDIAQSGCIILGDSANGTSPVYITASGATITATTTKPAACQSVQ